MTTEEAKQYCIEVIGMSESDFTKANPEDVACELAKEGEWVLEFKSFVPEGYAEWEMTTAIEIATDHKFWNDPKHVDSYVDFMMGEDDQDELSNSEVTM